jgi:hypothetical protein
MKEIFKGAALSATLRAGPFQNFYQGLLDRGMKPELARVTLARKIAAVTLTPEVVDVQAESNNPP